MICSLRFTNVSMSGPECGDKYVTGSRATATGSHLTKTYKIAKFIGPANQVQPSDAPSRALT